VAVDARASRAPTDAVASVLVATLVRSGEDNLGDARVAAARVAACRVSAALAKARSESTSAERATVDARSRVVGGVNIPKTRRGRGRVRGAATLSLFSQRRVDSSWSLEKSTKRLCTVSV
jgi:hypothetical protein